MMAKFVEYALKKSSIEQIIETPEGVEAARRRKGNIDYIFIMKHNNTPEGIKIPEDWRSVVGSEHMNSNR